jgi:hypothetical protein
MGVYRYVSGEDVGCAWFETSLRRFPEPEGTVARSTEQVTIHLGRSEALMTYCSLLLGALFRKTVYLDPLNDDVKLHV